uniref:Uncharacterized protein n=1 Tax=Meloidogyne enterolobii TaxID=390850 RepID=A0A6V7W7G5_MELEN|nr:unnamed protein product [Meloidogyne enterolobii]
MKNYVLHRPKYVGAIVLHSILIHEPEYYSKLHLTNYSMNFMYIYCMDFDGVKNSICKKLYKAFFLECLDGKLMLNIRDYNKNALEVHKKAGELNKKLVTDIQMAVINASDIFPCPKCQEWCNNTILNFQTCTTNCYDEATFNKIFLNEHSIDELPCCATKYSCDYSCNDTIYPMSV